MRHLLHLIVTVIALSALQPAMPVRAGDSNPLNAEIIERLLRDTLDQRQPGSTLPYHQSNLLDFTLIAVETLAPGHWRARADLVFDHGPPPPQVHGFQRIRSQPFHLLIKRHGKRLDLYRWSPVATVRLLPAGG